VPFVLTLFLMGNKETRKKEWRKAKSFEDLKILGFFL
jgi:hypothetical protein